MSESTVNIPIEKLHQFEGHPFSVPDNDEMNMLIESIQQNGIPTTTFRRKMSGSLQ